MKTKLFLSIALMLAFFCYSQSVITVDNSVGSNAQFSDLQSAISSASNNDIIYVHASEINYGNITIDKPLTLIGFSHSDTDKESMVTDLIFGSSASNCRITGLHITDDVFVDNVGVTLTNLVFENNRFDDAINFDNGGANDVLFRGNIIFNLGDTGTSSGSNNLTNAIVENNIITNNIYIKLHESVSIKNNIFLNENVIGNLSTATGDLIIQDCIFYSSIGSIYNPNNTGVVFENCLTYNNLSGVTNLVGTNNINDVNPLFVSATDDLFDAATDDYHLQGGSPAIGVGISGGDLGIFNAGPFVFNNFGYTNGIPTVKITAITNSVTVGGNLEVTINTNSN
ncbi:MAG: hypothetical protein GXO84_10765 [Chlorobi bacterium]|nr:hypothetical protein [Chlorobiota bacterium]